MLFRSPEPTCFDDEVFDDCGVDEQPVVIPSAAKAEVSTVILKNDVADACHTNVVDLYIKTSSQLTLVYFFDLPL